MTELQSAGRAPGRTRGQQNHLWLARHKAVPRPTTIPRTAYWQAIRALFPWDAFRYPGVERLAVELAQGRVTPHAVRMWRKGARRAPRWMWELIAAEAERRATALLHVAELAKKEAGD